MRVRNMRLFTMAAAALLLFALPSAAFASINEAEPNDTIDLANTFNVAQANSELLMGSLSESTDTDDVYSFMAFAGETVTLTFNQDTGMNFGYALYGPEATNLLAPFDSGGLSSSTYSFSVSQTGPYYIRVYTFAGGGTGYYSVNVEFPRQVTVAMVTPSSTLSFGTTPTVEGAIIGGRGGLPTGSATLYYSIDGLLWLPISRFSVPAGTTSFTSMCSAQGYPIEEKTYYKIIFEGNSTFAASSAQTYFTTKAYLTAPSAGRVGTRRYRMSGILGPTHDAGTYPVRIYLWRRVNGSWKAYGYQKAVAANMGMDSTYSKTFTFPYKGTWRLQAYHSDAGHLPTKSGYVTKSVY